VQGIRTSVWHEIIFQNKYPPLRNAFLDNLDLFTIMFHWHKRFNVHVYYCDGRVRSNETRR
jgi:hypothetical protein